MSLFDILSAEENGERVDVCYNRHEVCVVTTCPFCGKSYGIEVNEIDYLDWEDGKMAQDAFPYLSADEREMLISGICPTCWDKYFGSDEEPDPDYVDIHGNTFGGDE
jgi:hypothetical protein